MFWNITKTFSLLALLGVALLPLDAVSAPRRWITNCQLADETDSTGKLREGSLFTVLICTLEAQPITPQQNALAITMEEGEQHPLFVMAIAPQENHVVIAMANPETNVFAHIDSDSAPQVDNHVIINAVANFNYHQQVMQPPQRPAVAVAEPVQAAMCGNPLSISIIPYFYSNRGIDDDIMDGLSLLSKKAKRRNKPPQLNPKITAKFPILQVAAKYYPNLIKFWGTFQTYFFYLFPLASALSIIYDQAVQESVAEFEPQPEPSFNGCLMQAEVNLNELLLDMFNNKVLKERVTSRNTVREIVDAFDLAQGIGTNFSTTGEYIKTDDVADRCYCQCDGVRDAGNFGGCLIDLTLQSDVFERNLLDLTNSNYDSTLVSLETLRNSEFANSTLTTKVVLEGYFNGFDTALNSETDATCGCPRCPLTQTDSSKQLGNFLSSLSTYSLALLGTTVVIGIIKGAPYLYRKVIQ